MNDDLISREWLEDAFDNLCCHNCKICRNFKNEDSFYKCALIDKAPPTEAYSFEQVQELVKLNQQFAQEIENLKRPKGKWIRYRDNPHQPEHIKCSNCGQYWSVADHDKIFDICFKCGADMRGEENGNKS